MFCLNPERSVFFLFQKIYTFFSSSLSNWNNNNNKERKSEFGRNEKLKNGSFDISKLKDMEFHFCWHLWRFYLLLTIISSQMTCRGFIFETKIFLSFIKHSRALLSKINVEKSWCLLKTAINQTVIKRCIKFCKNLFFLYHFKSNLEPKKELNLN